MATAGAMLVSVVCFHCVVPAGLNPRHLVPALPAVVLFIFAGAQDVLTGLKRGGLAHQPAAAVVYGLIALAFVGATVSPVRGVYDGLGPVAAKLLADPANAKAMFLISSDATGEGIFISEVAMREQRPGHIIRRASKALASENWRGGAYKAKFESEPELIAFLEKEPIGVVILDESIPPNQRVPHHDLLRQTVEHHPERFTLIEQHDMVRAGSIYRDGIRAYRFDPRVPGTSRACGQILG
jgi:hypothetical protein